MYPSTVYVQLVDHYCVRRRFSTVSNLLYDFRRLQLAHVLFGPAGCAVAVQVTSYQTSYS